MSQEGAPARSMGCNAHLHVANAKDSDVQILQSLSARTTWITSMILCDFYHIFKEIYSTSAVRKFMVCFTIMSMG